MQQRYDEGDAQDQQFLSIPQAAEQIGASRVWLWQRVKDGGVPAIRVGRGYGIAAEVVPTISPPKMGRPRGVRAGAGVPD